MKIELLLGRANTGKSAELLRRLARHQQAGEKAVLIVPEQYTFEAERALSASLGGLLGVEALSFARLNERILSLSGQNRPFLSPQGHRMVIRRSALLLKEQLSVFSAVADRPGFAAEMQTVFSDLTRAGLSPEALLAAVEKLPEGSAIRGKLSDIALLYRETEAFLSDRYLTLDAAADRARELLPTSYLAGLPIYIDGIDRPSAQLYHWLSALFQCASSVTIALTIDLSIPPDADVFLPDMLLLSRIRDMAETLHIPVSTRAFDTQNSVRPDALAHLERNLFASPGKVYLGDARAITLFTASDRLAETEALADAILRAARRGVRYRDMAVIVSDPEAYMPRIGRVFARRGIPVFLDRKRPVSGHAAISALLSALNCISGGFAGNDLLLLCKSGYAGVSREDTEQLELYLLQTGLRGNALLSPFTRGEAPEGAERARATATGALLRLRDGLHGRTVREKVLAVYAYLKEIRLQETLSQCAQTLLANGRIALMEEHAQVWNTLLTLLDQLYAIMGELPMSREAFTQLLSEGLAGCELGVIPSTSDAVLIGDIARTKSRAVKCLFLVGVNDGLLPAVRGDDGIINDAELALMERAGMPISIGSRQRAAADRLDLYAALSKAEETIFISYSCSGGGSELSPSSLVTDIARLFPHCARETDIADGDALPESESEGMTMLSRDLCALHSDEAATSRLPALLAYFESRPAYATRVRRMLNSGGARFMPAPFGKKLASALYGERVRMSASRLEQFAACPFKHFLRYGLAAADRREYTERAADLGTFFHAALCAFVNEVNARGGNWQTLSDEDCDEILDALLPNVIAEHNGGIFLHNDRLRASLFLTVESIHRSARAVAAQVRMGAYTPLGAELRFGEGCPFPPLLLALPGGETAELSGVIDRVDKATIEGREALRVVDYKLGGRDFDFTGILSGLTLQLPLYLSAASQGGKTPAGMYYMPLTIPAVPDTESAAEAAQEAFRLHGLTLSEPSVVLANDAALLSGNSAVLQGVRRDADGAFTGSVCGEDQLSRLLTRAKTVSESLFTRMLEGQIDVDPAERACQYCEYQSACRFDPMQRGCRTRKFTKVRQADFFALIGGDTHALD